MKKCFFFFQVWVSPLVRWETGPSPTWSCVWMIRGSYAWSRRAPSKRPRSNLSSTSHSRRSPRTIERLRFVMESAKYLRWCEAVYRMKLTGFSFSLSADCCDSWERQTCAETDLGWQRVDDREGGDRWEISSCKDAHLFMKNTLTLIITQMSLHSIMQYEYKIIANAVSKWLLNYVYSQKYKNRKLFYRNDSFHFYENFNKIKHYY